MISIFKKDKPKGESVTLKIKGMHCTSCAMNVDGELEELPGVHSANTSYAKAEVKVEYDAEKITMADLKNAVGKAGYEVE